MNPDGANREKASSLVWITIVVVIVAGSLVFAAAFVFSRSVLRRFEPLARDMRSPKSVAAERPSAEELGLPLYPGAQPAESRTTIPLELPATGLGEITALEFDSADSIGKVAAYYRHPLGPGASERRDQGWLLLSSPERDGERRMVFLKAERLRTQLVLVRVRLAETAPAR